jgi:hypothetical protein
MLILLLRGVLLLLGLVLLLRRSIVLLLLDRSPRLSWLGLRLSKSGEGILVVGTVVSHGEYEGLDLRCFLWEMFLDGEKL